jgi:small-conductance mechanosensitive channel
VHFTFPESFTRIPRDGPLFDALMAFAVAAAVLLGLLALRRALRARYDTLRKTTKVEWSELPFRVLCHTAWPFLVAVALFAGSRWLDMPTRLARAVDIGFTIAVFWQMGLWFSAAFIAWLEHKRRHSVGADRARLGSLSVLGMVVRGLIWVLMTLLALDNLGVDITALVAGLGIGGVAVALALQNILGDLFASLAIALDKPFVVGDSMQVGDIVGTVEAIGIKSTRLRSLSGEQVIVSNADLLGSRVHNFGRQDERRVDFVLRLPYDTPTERLESLPARIRAIIQAQPKVRFDRCHLAGFGEYALEFECVYIKLSPDFNEHMDTRQAINLAILRELDSLGAHVELPVTVVRRADAAGAVAGVPDRAARH